VSRERIYRVLGVGSNVKWTLSDDNRAPEGTILLSRNGSAYLDSALVDKCCIGFFRTLQAAGYSDVF